MSPMSPSFMSGGQSNWPQGDWPKVQIPDFREKCPKCGDVLNEVCQGVGGFDGHETLHPGSLWGYNCSTCHGQFSLEEFMKLKEEKTREKARSDFAKDYWENLCSIFKDLYIYLIVMGFIFLYGSFWKGVALGASITLLIPLIIFWAKRKRKKKGAQTL